MTIPVVPPIEDADRSQVYETGSGTLTTLDLDYPLFGNADDLRVYVDDVELTTGWTLSLISGDPVASAIRPITDGRLTFSPVIGQGKTVEVLYTRVQRRSSQPTAGGLGRREYNKDVSDLVATGRELRRDVDRSLRHGIVEDDDGDTAYQAGGRRIAGVKDPTESDDAATKGYIATYIATESLSADVYQAAEDAINAAAGAALADILLAPTAAARLLGGENGRSVDYVANESFIRADTTDNDTSLADATFTRAGPAVNHTSNGYSTVVANGTAVRPYRRRGDGANRGIRVCVPQPNILYSASDPASADWTKSHCTVTLVSDKTAPDGTTNVWEIVKTSTVAFSTYVDSVSIKIENDRDYTFSWFVWRDTDLVLLQLKPTLTGGSAVTGNITFDLQNEAIVSEVNATGFIEVVDGNWLRLEVRMHNVNNTRAAFSAVFDVGDIAAQPTFYVGRAYVQEGAVFNGEIPVATQPRPATLTLAKWQQLFAGASAIGDFNGLNVITNTIFTTGWTLSNVTRTVNAGAGYGGADNYTMADSSGAATGFAQFQLVTALGATDHVYAGMFVYTAGVTSPFWEFRPQIYSTVTKLPRARINNTVHKVSQVTNDTTALAQCIPIDANTYLIIVDITNAGGANLRHTFYPDIIAAANTGAIRVSHPFLRVSSTALWTKETDANSYEIFNDVPFPGDVVTESTSTWDFTSLAGTVALDVDTMVVPDENGTNDHVLFSLDDNSVLNRIELYVRDDGAGDAELVGYWKAGNDTLELSGPVDSLYAARYAMTWGQDYAAIIRDDEIVASQDEAPPTVPSISKFRLGSNYAGNLQPNTSFLRWFHRPRQMSAEEIYAAGRVLVQVVSNEHAFTTTNLTTFAGLLASERTTKLARTRSNLMSWTSGVALLLANGQSFERGAWGNAPHLTTPEWLATKAWATALMNGGSVRDSNTSNSVYNAVTDGGVYSNAPRQLVGTTDNGDAVLLQSEIISSGIPSTSYAGEAPIVASAHEFTRLYFDHLGTTPDTTRRILAASVGSATDSSLAAISDTSGNPWLTQVDFIDDMKTWFSANPGTYGALSGILGFNWDHGQASYGQYVTQSEYINGGTTNTGIGLAAMMDNLNDLNDTKFGLTTAPLHVAMMPSMHWINDGAAIGKAWRELEDSRDDLVIAGSDYIAQNSATAGSEHPTAWGSITLGLHQARARHYVQNLGQNWIAPRIWKVWQKDDELIIGILAMTYPLQYLLTGGSYSSQPAAITNWGFRLTLDGVDIGIDEIEILEDYDGLIRIKMGSKPERAVTVDYAGQTTATGRGNVYDSSPDFTDWDYRTVSYPGYDTSRTLTGVTVAPGACGLLPDRVKATMVA